MEPEAQRLIGQIFKQTYQVEAHVATGGMAYLYKARHLALEEWVALKILKPAIAQQELMEARFLQEARLQFRLVHPHIARAFDVVQEEPWLGLVIEWVEGTDLQRLLDLRGAPLELEQLRDIFVPMLDGLWHAHTHQGGIVHRDLKPSNLLLAEVEGGFVPKLGDFGIAKALASGAVGPTATGAVLGSMMYMAPEQVRDSKRVDLRADIYSAGAMLYYALTGQPPFTGTAERLMFQHLYAPPPDPSDVLPSVPEPLAKVVLRCLHKKPSERFPDARALSEALADALQGSRAPQARLPASLESAEEPQPKADLKPSEARPEEPRSGAATASSFKKRRVLWVVSALMLAILGGWGGWRFFATPESQPASRRALPSTPAARSSCRAGEKRPCYRGDTASLGRGLCKAGVQRCDPKLGRFGPCKGEQLPQPERCNGRDDDCDGRVDEGIASVGRICQVRRGWCLRRGRWSCVGGRLRCRLDPGLDPKELRYVELRLRPRQIRFRLRLGTRQYRVQGWTCLALRKGGVLSIEAKGFHRCLFELPFAHRSLELRMRKRSVLAAEPPYCLGGARH